jgi:ribosomal protein L37AE/L43A
VGIVRGITQRVNAEVLSVTAQDIKSKVVIMCEGKHKWVAIGTVVCDRTNNKLMFAGLWQCEVCKEVKMIESV